MLFSTKGYYSMSPYDDGYVSFICFHLYFLSFLRSPPLILLVPRRISPTSSSLCLYVCLPFLYYISISLAIFLWFLLDCASLKGCLMSSVVRMTAFVWSLVKPNKSVSFRACFIIKFSCSQEKQSLFLLSTLLFVCQSSFFKVNTVRFSFLPLLFV